MLLRRATPLLALALAALACEPPVPFDPAAHNPAFVDYAVFDPQPDATDQSPADIPLPNDLALQDQAIATQPAAEAEVLKSFQAQGGFPADQNLPITFDFVRINIDPGTGATTRSAPPLDVASINPSNLIILSLSAAGVGPVAYDAPAAADYVVLPDDPTKPTGNKHGTLIVHKKADASGLREYPAAVYVAAVKGGAHGVHLVGGGNVNPRPTMYLITQGVDLTRPENQGLIPGNTREEKAATAALLEQLRKAYLLPFAALQGAGFATSDIASLTAFSVTSDVHVSADPVAAAHGVPGALPFPSDFLLDPVTHHLLPAVQDPVHGPFGPLGPGLGTLDGFSTTGIITATMSGLIDPTTVNKDTVFVYELTAAGPKRVPEARELASGLRPGFVAVSSQLVAAGTSATNVVGLQPGVPIPLPTGGAYALPALHEGSEYAVVLTDGITEPGGKRTAQATLGRLLALSNPLLVGTTPTIAGLALSDAQQLEPLRQALKPVLDDLAATKNITRPHVTMAYTIRTQSGIKTTAGLLSSLPYGTPLSTLSPLATPAVSCNNGLIAANPAVCASAASLSTTLSQYGVDPTVVPNANIGYIVEAVVPTFSKLRCPASPDPTAAACAAYLTAVNGGKDTGAFLPASFDPQPEAITAVISVPLPPYGASSCVPSSTNLCTVPLIIFRHGVGGSRRAMLFLANELNKAGFVVAAIDAAKEGDRSYCDAGAAGECASGASCVADPEFSGEGDAPLPSPGHCMASGSPADFARDTTTCPSCTNTKSTPLVSSNFLTSFNLFRTRDTLRQDIIDQSQLIRLLSPNPGCDLTKPPTDPNTCANNLITATTGVQIDPQRIYFTGQSLGAMQGVVDAASNPRVAKVALNVAGATTVDVFATGSFSTKLNALLALKGLDKASNPAGYLQFLTVAKWIVDPADPINFAQNLAANTIPFGAPQLNALVPAPASRPVIGQMALCDKTVPNQFNLELYELIGLGPASNTLTVFVNHGGVSCPANAVNHGFITDWADWGTGSTSIVTQAQDDIGAFFANGTLPPNLRSAP